MDDIYLYTGWGSETGDLKITPENLCNQCGHTDILKLRSTYLSI
jgi:hypothetical protein